MFSWVGILCTTHDMSLYYWTSPTLLYRWYEMIIHIHLIQTFFLKGIPLHLQVDTYEDLASPNVDPVHRAFCQIKVFRDKASTVSLSSPLKSWRKLRVSAKRQWNANCLFLSCLSDFFSPDIFRCCYMDIKYVWIRESSNLECPDPSRTLTHDL